MTSFVVKRPIYNFVARDVQDPMYKVIQLWNNVVLWGSPA